MHVADRRISLRIITNAVFRLDSAGMSASVSDGITVHTLMRIEGSQIQPLGTQIS
jgi:hypothetical protein